MTTQVEFSTTQFEFAHGHAPRGRGGWAFEIRGMDRVFFAPSGTFSEARAWMRGQVAQVVQADAVRVCVEVCS